MKKLMFLVVAIVATVFNVDAQVKIETPHADLLVKIDRCVYNNGEVLIDLKITNIGAEDKVYFLASKCSAYDDEGNIYSASNTEFKHGIPTQQLKATNHSYIIIPRDIPIKYRFQIGKINPNASKLSLLKLAASSRGALGLKAENPIQIRNLEWQK